MAMQILGLQPDTFKTVNNEDKSNINEDQNDNNNCLLCTQILHANKTF